MHIGHQNCIDIDFTLKRRRGFDELIVKLPEGSEREYFSNDKHLRAAFPQGTFNCWGVPIRAHPAFLETAVGDVVLFAPWIGVHEGGIYYLGVVKAICELECWNASRILWPETPDDRLFPWLIFFDTEVGYHEWYRFLDDVEIGHKWNPRGWYRQIQSSHFSHFGGVEKYVEHLRNDIGFRPL
jgi:hypothetical protein